MSEKVQQTETGNALQRFLKRKNIIFSAKRYGIDALGAMAQGLFASLLIGTIIGTLGEQIGSQVLVDAGGFAKSVAGPAMAISIGYALQAPQLVLFSLLAVGAAANSLGGAGGPLAVLIVAIVAAECGKAVSKETKIDILVTPLVTILSGVLLSMWCAPTIGAAASAVGSLIMWATELQPFFMGILVSVIVGVALTLPISSAAICAALNLTGLAGGCGSCGLLCADGRLCGDEFQRKQVERTNFPGIGHKYAADGQYRKKSAHLDSTDAGGSHHRTDCDLSVPASDERTRSFLRNGNLRTGGTDRRLYRLAGRNCSGQSESDYSV